MVYLGRYLDSALSDHSGNVASDFGPRVLTRFDEVVALGAPCGGAAGRLKRFFGEEAEGG